MRLATMQLQGFRCFGHDSVTVEFGDLTALVGLNGSGKTAVLMGLARMFGISSGLRTLTKEDFHLPSGLEEEPSELRLKLEASFELPELLDDEEADRSIAVPECLRHIMVDDSESSPQIRIRLCATWTASASAEGEIDWVIEWVDSLADEPPEDAVHPLRGIERGLIQVFYVPAARDAVRELRAVSGTILARALRHIGWSDEVKERLLELGFEMETELRSVEAFASLEAGLQQHWTDLRGGGVGKPELSVAETDLSTLLRRIDPHLAQSATENRPLGLLSEGERSLMYFALMASSLEFESEYLTSSESAPDHTMPALTILAVEEPENHLAPQYLSRILKTLREIKNHRAAQVAITSHSASILSRVEPSDVRHFRVDENQGHVVSRLALPDDTDEAFKYVREAVRAYPELYFARAIVFGEGPSEEVVLPRVAAAFELDIDPRFVAVVPLGGRHVHHFWRLLHDLGTPYVTLLDLDMERATGGWTRIHEVIQEVLEVRDSATIEEFLPAWPPDDMRKWESVSMDDDRLKEWLTSLENEFDVYFSAPLDLDLLMLDAFPEQYHALAPTGGGPRPISSEEAKRNARLKRLVRSVLGDSGTDGLTYRPNIKRFAWYSYLFLSGSKPVAHARVLAEISVDELRAKCPPVLRRLVEKMKKLAD